MPSSHAALWLFNFSFDSLTFSIVIFSNESGSGEIFSSSVLKRLFWGRGLFNSSLKCSDHLLFVLSLLEQDFAMFPVYWDVSCVWFVA